MELHVKDNLNMDLKELKALWREEDFRPNKKLGQNFLIDKNVRDNILKALCVDSSKRVLEIGAGFGVMSFELAAMCGKLFAVEKDRRICGIMAERFREKDITLIEASILDVDICALAKDSGALTVFGNIPYYISTPVIEKMIRQRKCIDAVYLVIQEELAERIASSSGSRVYGSISCFVQFYMEVKKLFRIKKNSFYPRPRVDSHLVELKVLSEPSVKVTDEALMFRIVRKAFSQRRKKAVNPLSQGDFASMTRDDWIRLFESCGIDPASRAESLSLEDYARVSDAAGERFAGRKA